MRITRFFSVPAYAAILAAPMVLSACGSMKIWPYGGDASSQGSGPANSAEYRCEGNRYFYLRMQDKGETAWIILRDREFGLAKINAGSYSNGTSTLALNGDEATLTLGEKNVYAGCKIPAPVDKDK